MADEQHEALAFQAARSEDPAPQGPLSADETRIFTRVVQHSISHSGPLPPPEILQGYEQILKGSAERILAMAEKQSNHRQALESAVILGGIKAESRGAFYAFALGLSGIASAAFLAWLGQSLFGLATLASSLGALVSVFIIGRREQSKERQEKSASTDE